MKIGERISKKRKEKGITLDYLGKLVGMSRATLSRYESGDISNIPSDRIEAIAKALNTTPAYLMGWEASEPSTTTGLIKLYDGIPAGAPAFLDEQVIDYIPTLLPNPNDYAGIKVHGDSMIGRSITDGCTVIIKKQDCADNGQIVACRVNNDEVTLKIFSQQGDTVILSPANPSYSPIIVPVSEFENGSAQILGVAVKIETDII